MNGIAFLYVCMMNIPICTWIWNIGIIFVCLADVMKRNLLSERHSSASLFYILAKVCWYIFLTMCLWFICTGITFAGRGFGNYCIVINSIIYLSFIFFFSLDLLFLFFFFVSSLILIRTIKSP